MALKACQSFSKVFLVTAMVAVLVGHDAEARYRGINPWCTTSDHRMLCTHMVKGATNWHDASLNCMTSAIETATRLQGMKHLIEPSITDLLPSSRDSVLAACKLNFDDAVYNLERAVNFLNAGDVGGILTFLSAVSISDCLRGFEQFGATFPPALDPISSLLSREVGNCLAVTQQI